MQQLLRGDQYCQCISKLTFPAPNGQLNFVAKCYQNGEEKGILESRNVNNLEDARSRAADLMKKYKIKKDDCIQFPGGPMIFAPSQ